MATLNLETLIVTYKAVKAHDNEIMARRPTGHASADWRMTNPHHLRTSWRVTRDGKKLAARLNYDTTPWLDIYPAKGGGLIENIDLRSPDAQKKLAAFEAAGSNDMIAREFRWIREGLGLTQAQLAPLLDLGSAMRVSEFERATNPRSIPKHIARVMNAMASGWRPNDWPIADGD